MARFTEDFSFNGGTIGPSMTDIISKGIGGILERRAAQIGEDERRAHVEALARGELAYAHERDANGDVLAAKAVQYKAEQDALNRQEDANALALAAKTNKATNEAILAATNPEEYKKIVIDAQKESVDLGRASLAADVESASRDVVELDKNVALTQASLDEAVNIGANLNKVALAKATLAEEVKSAGIAATKLKDANTTLNDFNTAVKDKKIYNPKVESVEWLQKALNDPLADHNKVATIKNNLVTQELNQDEYDLKVQIANTPDAVPKDVFVHIDSGIPIFVDRGEKVPPGFVTQAVFTVKHKNDNNNASGDKSKSIINTDGSINKANLVSSNPAYVKTIKEYSSTFVKTNESDLHNTSDLVSKLDRLQMLTGSSSEAIMALLTQVGDNGWLFGVGTGTINQAALKKALEGQYSVVRHGNEIVKIESYKAYQNLDTKDKSGQPFYNVEAIGDTRRLVQNPNYKGENTQPVNMTELQESIANEADTTYGKYSLDAKSIVNIGNKEGLRPDIYLDTNGNLTGGIGHKLNKYEANKYPKGTIIPIAEIQKWFKKDISIATEAALEQSKKLGINLESPIGAALIGVNFQLGQNWNSSKAGTSGHVKTWLALQNKDYNTAVKELKSSAWYRQTPDRVADLIQAIELQKISDARDAQRKLAKSQGTNHIRDALLFM